ncbi:hypothetical protein N8D55_01450 [Xanthomonas hortorum pv. pelargonii]|nr:hypothetical protein N8D55_01450 [Xanthomonas hortorum pv. pelargonii]
MHELLNQTEALQNLLISQATGGSEDDAEFVRLRQMLLSNQALDPLIPRFIRTCRNLSQFWQFIKFKYSTYAERRDFIWGEFHPLLETLERGPLSPADQIVSEKLEKFDASHVQAAWSKALERRAADPEGLSRRPGHSSSQCVSTSLMPLALRTTMAQICRSFTS